MVYLIAEWTTLFRSRSGEQLPNGIVKKLSHAPKFDLIGNLVILARASLHIVGQTEALRLVDRRQICTTFPNLANPCVVNRELSSKIAVASALFFPPQWQRAGVFQIAQEEGLSLSFGRLRPVC